MAFNSRAVSKGTAYRTVMRRLVAFAENELKTLHPELDRGERIKKAHEEPFWSAAKGLRDLTLEEKQQVGLIK